MAAVQLSADPLAPLAHNGIGRTIPLLMVIKWHLYMKYSGGGVGV